MKDQVDLESRARELYPSSDHLQKGWIEAVNKVRTTRDGWRFDAINPRTAIASAALVAA
jgi:hypothetical protein